MWSPIYQMLAICVLGLTVLGASADIYPVHPTEADLVSKGQCYSYIDGMNYSIAASLQPCMEKCPGTQTVEVGNVPHPIAANTFPGLTTLPFPPVMTMTLLRRIT